MDKKDKRKILEHLKTNKLMTISTIASASGVSGRPQAALVAFAELPTLEIVFQTFEGSRKHGNLAANDKVALVIGWDLATYITLQYEGRAVPLTQDQTRKYHKAFLDKDSPSSEFFLNHPKARFFRITPTWLRYSNYSCDLPQFIEHTFEA